MRKLRDWAHPLGRPEAGGTTRAFHFSNTLHEGSGYCSRGGQMRYQVAAVVVLGLGLSLAGQSLTQGETKMVKVLQQTPILVVDRKSVV